MLGRAPAADPLRRQPAARLPLRRGCGPGISGDRRRRSTTVRAERPSTPAATSPTRSPTCCACLPRWPAPTRARYPRGGQPEGEIDRQYLDSTQAREHRLARRRSTARGPGSDDRVVSRAPRGPRAWLREAATVKWAADATAGGHRLSRKFVFEKLGPTMCGRFTVTTKTRRRSPTASRSSWRRRWASRRWNRRGGRYNVAPAQEVLTVRSSPDPRRRTKGKPRR